MVGSVRKKASLTAERLHRFKSSGDQRRNDSGQSREHNAGNYDDHEITPRDVRGHFAELVKVYEQSLAAEKPGPEQNNVVTEMEKGKAKAEAKDCSDRPDQRPLQAE